MPLLPTSLPELFEFLKSGYAADQLQINKNLHALGKSAVPLLLQKLHGTENIDADLAAQLLGRLGETAIPSLLPLLQHPDDTIRQRAVESLEFLYLSPASTIPPQSKYHSTLVSALLPLLNDSSYYVCLHTLNTLGVLKSPAAISDLIEFFHEAEAVNLRAHALLALGRIDTPETIPLFLQVLQSEYSEERYSALSALGYRKDSAYLPYFLHALQDNVANVRSSALGAITYLIDQQANLPLPSLLPALLQSLQNSTVDTPLKHHWSGFFRRSRTFSDVRCETLELLGKIDTPETYSVLLQALQDSTPSIRLEACRQLRKSRHPETLSALLPLLQDPEAVIRTSVADSLRILGNPDAIPALRERLTDPDYYVQQSVRNALINLGDTPPPLQTSPETDATPVKQTK